MNIFEEYHEQLRNVTPQRAKKEPVFIDEKSLDLSRQINSHKNSPISKEKESPESVKLFDSFIKPAIKSSLQDSTRINDKQNLFIQQGDTAPLDNRSSKNYSNSQQSSRIANFRSLLPSVDLNYIESDPYFKKSPAIANDKTSETFSQSFIKQFNHNLETTNISVGDNLNSVTGTNSIHLSTLLQSPGNRDISNKTEILGSRYSNLHPNKPISSIIKKRDSFQLSQREIQIDGTINIKERVSSVNKQRVCFQQDDDVSLVSMNKTDVTQQKLIPAQDCGVTLPLIQGNLSSLQNQSELNEPNQMAFQDSIEIIQSKGFIKDQNRQNFYAEKLSEIKEKKSSSVPPTQKSPINQTQKSNQKNYFPSSLPSCHNQQLPEISLNRNLTPNDTEKENNAQINITPNEVQILMQNRFNDKLGNQDVKFLYQLVLGQCFRNQQYNRDVHRALINQQK